MLLTLVLVALPFIRVAPGVAAAGQTLHVLAGVVGGKTPAEMTLFNQYLTKQLGFPVQMETPPQASTKLAAVLASGSYDVVFMNLNNLLDVYPQHLLTPLDSDIAHSKLLSNKSLITTQMWNEVRAPDGKIYGAWMTSSGGRLPIVRQDWMNALHLSTPTTLSQFEAVFKQINKHYHAYGLDLSGIYDIQPFMSAVGVRDGYEKVQGKWIVPYATKAALPVYAWLHKLYTEKLLDPNFVTDTTADERSKFLTGHIGSFVYWDAWVGDLNNIAHTNDPKTSFDAEGIPPAVGPHGIRLLNMGQPALWTIPITSHNHVEALKFIEYWLTPAGHLLGSLGLPGYDYTVTNGTYKLTAIGKRDNMDHGLPYPLGDWKNPIGYLPGFRQARVLVDKYGFLAITRPTTDAVTTVEEDYIAKAILGQLSPSAALNQMHQAMLSRHLIDQ
jgi:putative aldouronate transport system substrate-binding protein